MTQPVIAAVPQPDTEATRTRLSQLQGSMRVIEQELAQATHSHEQHQSRARDWFERSKQTRDVAMPLAEHHDKWLKIGNTCRTVGKIATFAVPVGVMAAVGLGHNPIVGAALLADMAVVGATLFTVRKSQAITEREGPKIDRLVDEWKAARALAERANAAAESAKDEITRLQSDLRKKQGDAQIMEMALAMPATPLSPATIVSEVDAIQIGSLRIPRRATPSADYRH